MRSSPNTPSVLPFAPSSEFRLKCNPIQRVITTYAISTLQVAARGAASYPRMRRTPIPRHAKINPVAPSQNIVSRCKCSGTFSISLMYLRAFRRLSSDRGKPRLDGFLSKWLRLARRLSVSIRIIFSQEAGRCRKDRSAAGLWSDKSRSHVV